MSSLHASPPAAAVPVRTSRPDLHVRTVVAVLAAIVTAGCATTTWNERSTRAEELAIYETAARFVVQHYAPSGENGARLAAVCLVAGRRAHLAVGTQRRDDRWDPDPGLLGRLHGLPYPVVPVSECAWNARVEEVHLPSGGPAVVLGLSYPFWDGPGTAFVDVVSRESVRHSFRYRCRLDWKVDQWAVNYCLSPGGPPESS